ncbi:MAG: type II toxin-antitoxin system VapC family toxin [Actinomycetia bacterium]|nr:type II toxin-antitoxin system VapC family toxin [Actinomycetes bacterium]
MYLLDTNVISGLRKSRRLADANVAAWVAAQHADELFVSVVTILEIELGIARLERRDREQAARLLAWLQSDVLPSFADRVLPIGLREARRAARLHVPDPRPERDAYLAATALTHDLTVVTRNVADFEPTGAAVLNPWLAGGPKG